MNDVQDYHGIARQKYSQCWKALKELTICKFNAIAECLDLIAEYVSFVSMHSLLTDVSTESVYELILIAKYLSAQYHGDYLDNPENTALGREIAALESRLYYRKCYDENKKSELAKLIQDKYRYCRKFSERGKPVSIPTLSTISIPEKSAIIDFYIFYEVINESTIQDQEISVKIAVHLLIPDANGNEKRVLRLPDIDAIQLEEMWNELFFNIDETTSDDYIEDKAESIYMQMFAEAEKHIDGYSTLYISPDSFLFDYPMDCLVACERERNFFNRTVVYIQSALDAVPDYFISLKKPLIIGDPTFYVDSDSRREKKHTVFTPIPHARIESRIISSMLKTSLHASTEASKTVLLENLDSSLIHIASHGSVIEDGCLTLTATEGVSYRRYVPLSGSAIFLAGYNDWQVERKQKNLGSGLLTAQEVSFWNLSSTDLVVLSVCMGGQGVDENSRGLRWAFTYAGAKAVVSCLPCVNDCSTAIFMVIFYRNLMSFPIARAFTETKNTCYNLSLNEILADRELSAIYHCSSKGIATTNEPIYPLCDDGTCLSISLFFNGGRI